MTFGGFHKNKRRSKQKNLKRDTRPENLRPGGADYVPLSERPGYVAPPEPPVIENDQKESSSNTSSDIPLNCRDCTEQFMFTFKEQKIYKAKGYDSMPSRCKNCRETKRSRDADSTEKQPEMKKSKPEDQPTKQNKIKKKGKKSIYTNISLSERDMDDEPNQKVVKTEAIKKIAPQVKAKKIVLGKEDSDSSDSSSDSDSDSEDKEKHKVKPVESDESNDDDSDEDDSDDEVEDDKKEGNSEEEEDDSDDSDDSEEDSDDEEQKSKNIEEKGEIAVGGGEEEEEEEEVDEGMYWGYDARDDHVCAEEVKPFDLYEALELSPSFILEEGKVKGGNSRLRAQYHKLSMRYHPDSFKPKRSGNVTPIPTQRASAEQHFRRVAIAFETLKDPARAAIYALHGFEGLVKSESYANISVLDTQPFARFDAFFEGTDPEDREYLLLEAASGGNFSDEEQDMAEVTEAEDNDGEEDSEDDDSEEDEDECLQEAMKEVNRNKGQKAKSEKTSELKGLPMPPAGTSAVLSLVGQSMVQATDPTDPFAKIAKLTKEKKTL